MTEDEIRDNLWTFLNGRAEISLSETINAAMELKGFWPKAGFPLAWEKHIWKQFAHLAIEIGEYLEAQALFANGEDNARPEEELADVFIVLCDLMGGLGHNISSVLPVIDIVGHTEDDLSILYSKLANGYRKTSLIDPQAMTNFIYCIVNESKPYWHSLTHCVYDKMIKNLARPHRYGVTISETSPQSDVQDRNSPDGNPVQS